MTPHTSWPQRIALVAGGFVAALLLAEIVLRAGGVEYPALSRPDDDRGWVLKPGARGHSEAEGDALIVVNSAGLRDREHARPKPAGTLRIAVLGDSYAEAREVPLEQAFWSVLERDLNQRLAGHRQRVEVLNFGVRGYGTLQELLTLRCCVWEYAPDVVLLAVYSGNDVSDNSPVLDRGTTQYARPYFRPTATGWTIDQSFRQNRRFRVAKWIAPLVAHSRVLQLVIRAQHIILHWRNGSRGGTSVAQMNRELGWDSRVYTEPDAQWSEAWQTTDALVGTLASDVADHGARFALVVTTNPVQVYPDSALRARFARQLGAADLLGPDRRFQAWGVRDGYPALALASEFQTYADAHHAFLHGFTDTAPGVGHWNRLGHRLAGERIATWMADWIEPPQHLISQRRGTAPDSAFRSR